MKKRIDQSLEFRNKDFKLRPWQLKVQEVIYGTETRTGKLFDIILLIVILASIIVVMLESVNYLNVKYSETFKIIEWIITGLFTIEYILRILSLKRPLTYIFSFFGLIDLLALLPSYLGLFFAGSESLMVIRVVRFLRIFKVLRLSSYMLGADILGDALKNSRHKIIVFLISILTIVIIMGGIMYFIEPNESGFTSIPRSIYWAIITITTVGYGDIAPVTALGQAIASLIMLFGYAIIAVPTGIVSSEIATAKKTDQKLFKCPNCKLEGHDQEAKYCKYCGDQFNSD
ncbi:MAG: ion transporter [Fluviicola sp.]|nr:MAG: ion transporter [Fluviicola sp.]